MGINLRLITLFFTNQSTQNINLKNISNLYNGSYNNNISMFLMFNLQGDNNLSIINTNDIVQYGDYDGNTLLLRYRIKHSDNSKTGLFFQNIFNYPGTLTVDYFINDIWSTSTNLSINSLSYNGIDIIVILDGIQSAKDGLIVSFTLYIQLNNDFVKYSGLSEDTIQFTQYLTYIIKQQS